MQYGKLLIAFVVVSVFISLILFFLDNPRPKKEKPERTGKNVTIKLAPNNTEAHQNRTETVKTNAHLRSKRSTCPEARVHLMYTLGSNTSYQIDLCDIIECAGGMQGKWRGYEVYLCGFRRHQWCPSWAYVWSYTGSHWNPDGSAATSTQGSVPLKEHITVMRGSLKRVKRGLSLGQNPLIITINNLHINPLPHSPCGNNKTANMIVGVDLANTDPMGSVTIHFIIKPIKTKETSIKNKAISIESPSLTTPPTLSQKIVELDFNLLTTNDILRIATGYGDKNIWLDWLIYTARKQNQGNCIACSTARPSLLMVPGPIHLDDTDGLYCLTAMYTPGTNLTNCTALLEVYPLIPNTTIPPLFVPKKGHYVCFNRTGKIHMSLGNGSWCGSMVDVTNWTNSANWTLARGDLFWYCGKGTLTVSLPANWSGVCSLVRLAVPMTLIGSEVHTRKRRSFNLQFNNPTYIDAIGVPRGVPNEYKLADQIAAGFENIPIISALIPITPNKNVDRINYIHYNVLRLTNLTRDAIAGLAEQMAPTSLMVIQNRMALDMLLAEKGGVCSMFQDSCCIFIPNNTAPDGTVTKALEGLRTLSESMHDDSGINSPINDWLDRTFGKWKSMVVSLFSSILAVCACLVLCGCCCIPCIRHLTERVIISAVQRKHPDAPPSYQMAMFQAERQGLLEMVGDSEDVDPEEVV